MSTRAFSQTSLDLDTRPSIRSGPGFRTVSVSSYSSSSSDESVEVPEDRNSLGYLLFAGCDDTAAREIWQAWQRRGERPDLVVDDARYYIEQKAREFDAFDEQNE